MNVNKHVVVATGIIVAGGIVKKLSQPNGGSITPVLLGGMIFMIPLAVLDLFGGGFSQLASALAMLAALTAILTEVPWTQIFQFAGVKLP